MLSAYEFWDISPEGTSFTLNFPFKSVPQEEGVCMDGLWTLTKVPTIFLLKFRESDPTLVIPDPSDAMLVALAHSKENPHKYLLARRHIRSIIEWAECESVSIQIHEQKLLFVPD